MDGIALYRASGLSAGPPARITAWTLADMSSTVTTPFLLVRRRSPLCTTQLYFTKRACTPSQANPPRVVVVNLLDLDSNRSCHDTPYEEARHLGDESDGGRSSTAATEAPLPLVLSASPASSCWELTLCAFMLPATARGVRQWGGADALLVLAAKDGPRKPLKALCILLVCSWMAPGWMDGWITPYFSRVRLMNGRNPLWKHQGPPEVARTLVSPQALISTRVLLPVHVRDTGAHDGKQGPSSKPADWPAACEVRQELQHGYACKLHASQ